MHKITIFTILLILAAMTSNAQANQLYSGVITSMCGRTKSGGFNNSHHRLLSFSKDSVGILDFDIEFTQDYSRYLHSGTHNGWKYCKWIRKGNSIIIQEKENIFLKLTLGKEKLVQQTSEFPIIYSARNQPQPATASAGRSYAFEKDNTSMLLSFSKDSLLIQQYASKQLIFSEVCTWLAIQQFILVFGSATQQVIFWNHNNTISLSDGTLLNEIKPL